MKKTLFFQSILLILTLSASVVLLEYGKLLIAISCMAVFIGEILFISYKCLHDVHQSNLKHTYHGKN